MAADLGPPLSPYAPRAAFLGLHRRAERWAIVVAHRRAGKTVACINELIKAAATCPLPAPRFAYVAPLLNQAKDIAWNCLLEYSDCFGDGRRVNSSELWVELPGNRARIRLYGADNPDRLRGLYLDGVVLDEYGDMEPRVWTSVIRPALSDREGFAIFIGTPKGRNGFWRLWEAAGGAASARSAGRGDEPAAEADSGPRPSPGHEGARPAIELENGPRPAPGHLGDGAATAGPSPGWYRLMLKASETRLLGDKELADARRTMSDEEYAQEYECSFDAAVRGAYWGKEMAALEAAGRVGRVAHDPGLQVHTAWDLGMADSTVIWFFQTHAAGGETRVIDVVKGEGVGLGWYVNAIRERPALHGAGDNWVWGNHYLPHDAAVRELGTGQSRVELLGELGIRATICRNLPVEDGIQAVRTMLPTCWFDAERCRAGIEALRMYRREYDARTQEYRVRPLHDWTSHYADAFRYFAVEHRRTAAVPVYAMRKPKRNTSWVV